MEKEFSLNENCYDRDAPEKVKFLGLKSKRFSYPEIGDRTQEEIKRAKLKHRSELSLKDWDKCKYYKSNWCEKILKNPPKGQQEISYENYNELTIEDFREKYEKSNKPVIIRGCTQNWPASTEWSLNIGEKRRPPYRWFLIGPKRSGTAMHLDPLGTSAWNASIKGHKLWLLLPPEISRSIVKSKDLIKKGEDDEAIIYMKDIFPRIKEKYGADLKEMWFIQNPGDLIFVPGGWWHAVVNLDDTVAVTQNYCNSVNFSRVWTHVRSERKKMAVKFLKKLQKYKPEIYELAININKTDQFLMYDELKKFYQNKKTEKAENKDKYRATSGSSSSSSSSSDSDSSTSSYLTDN